MLVPFDSFSLPLIADGGPGERLRSLSPAGSPSPESLNLSEHEQVKSVHGEYLAAGATLHRTNTSLAGPLILRESGLEERCETVNVAGPALARTVIGGEALLAGSIGEIPRGAGGGEHPPEERQRSYSEQIIYLSDAGVTFLLLEHFTSLEEALLVLRIAIRASDAPVLVHMRFGADWATSEKVPWMEAGRELVRAGAGGLGIGCGPGSGELPSILEGLRRLDIPLAVLLGLKGNSGARPYPGAPELTPTQFAQLLAPMADQGAVILGGCCGVPPTHIKALAAQCKPVAAVI